MQRALSRAGLLTQRAASQAAFQLFTSDPPCVHSSLGSGSALPPQGAAEPQVWTTPSVAPARGFSSFGRGERPDLHGPQWAYMLQQGYKINPCNSPLHPAVKEGAVPSEPDADQVSVQSAYTPGSHCYGCGPRAAEGLHLSSFRCEGGLVARLELGAKYCAFPGIINGGVVSTLMDCHGNWTAAIALMDRSCLPKPPLTLTASILVTYKEPTPPDQPLLLRSKIIEIKESSLPGGKAQVEVDISLFLVQPVGGERLLAHGTGLFKRQGALRAL